jgi:hypothetical protein
MLRWLRGVPKHLIEQRRRMTDAMVGYPVYEPPYRQGPNHPSHLQIKGDEEYARLFREFLAQGRENFAYFMESRDARLAALRAFLTKFEVTIGLDDTGLAAVSAWCPENCGALVANLRANAIRQAFFQMRQPWTEWQRGFNVIFDLGLFLGECVIARNNCLTWNYRSGSSDDGSTNLSGYEIIGFRNKRDWLDPAQYMYNVCLNAEDDLRLKRVGRFLRADTLIGVVRDFSTR